MQCSRRSMKISYGDHVTNEMVLEQVDEKTKLLPMVKSRKLKYFGHISRHTSLKKDITLGTTGMSGLRRQGGQRKEWSDDLVEWTGESIPDLVGKAEWSFEDLFMRLPTLASRVRHID